MDDMKLKIFDIAKKINESKTLTKHNSCKCRCELDGTKYDSRKKWNNDRCYCECKKINKIWLVQKGLCLKS